MHHLRDSWDIKHSNIYIIEIQEGKYREKMVKM